MVCWFARMKKSISPLSSRVVTEANLGWKDVMSFITVVQEVMNEDSLDDDIAEYLDRWVELLSNSSPEEIPNAYLFFRNFCRVKSIRNDPFVHVMDL